MIAVKLISGARHGRPGKGPALCARAPSIKVWQIDLSAHIVESEERLLDASERARCARFAFERDRRRFAGTRVALRTILGAALDIAPESVALTAGSFGKPALLHPMHVTFNVSHSDDLALIAIGIGIDALGVDVEACRRMSDATALAATHFSADEQSALAASPDPDRDFLTIWTRKEAVVKALGLGVGSLDLSAVQVALGGRLNVRVSGAVVWVAPLDARDGYISSVAHICQQSAVPKFRTMAPDDFQRLRAGDLVG